MGRLWYQGAIYMEAGEAQDVCFHFAIPLDRVFPVFFHFAVLPQWLLIAFSLLPFRTIQDFGIVK